MIDSAKRSFLLLMKPNLAKTFGFLLERALQGSPISFCVLDEIEWNEVPNEMRMIDLRPIPPDRYSITIKSLRLF